MDNFIIIAVLLIIVGACTVYIIKAKKSGKKCIGCPDSGSCPSNKNASCQCCCGCADKTDKGN